MAANALLLYDRLFSVAKTMNSTAVEAVSGTFTRYQSAVATDASCVGRRCPCMRPTKYRRSCRPSSTSSPGGDCADRKRHCWVASAGAVAAFFYDSKLQKLLPLPFVFASGNYTKYLIDNKNRRMLMDRRMEKKKIVAFSVGAQGDLVRTNFAMPSTYPTLTFSGFYALVENGLIAAYGTDGLTKLALGSAGVTLTKDAYKKQRDPVVKDGETYTFAELAFSGNPHHLG